MSYNVWAGGKVVGSYAATALDRARETAKRLGGYVEIVVKR